ncbi:MAG: cysteine desulfurase [Proteobacteria bacterium]|nr:cysteine desulfurase [Pseudomonadota bacterium]
MKRVYLDYNATTPVDPAVAEAAAESISNIYGNPSSLHAEGRASKNRLDDAREPVASLINCLPSELVFTGSGSEANNLAIKGVAEALAGEGRHIISSAVEHPSVIKTLDYLEGKGWEITRLSVDRAGQIDLAELALALRDDTVLVSLMLANNETGVLFPLAEAVRMAHEKGAFFHTDAVQAVGKIDVDVKTLGVDLLSLAGHKFYAPKGIGALYVKKGLELSPIIHGGGQELGRRAGTEALSGIAALAKAASIAKSVLPAESERIGGLRDSLKAGLLNSLDGVVFNAEGSPSLPNTLSVSFSAVNAESLLISLDLEGFAVSAGSACSSGALSGSPVLTAMGLDKAVVEGTLRISLGRWTSKEDVDRFLEVLSSIIERLRKS